MQSTTTPAQLASSSAPDMARNQRNLGRPASARLGRLARFLAIGSLLSAVTACDPGADAERTKLFDENGVWSLQTLDFGRGGGRETLGSLAKDAYLLKFKNGSFKGAAASCSQASDGHFEPLKTKCRLEKPDDSRDWMCHCFEYNVGETQMMLKLTKSSNDEDDFYSDDDEGDSEDGSGSEEESGGSDKITILEGPEMDPDDKDVTVVNLQNTGKVNVKIFGPLPGPTDDNGSGIFGSDGENSSFEMVQRASGVFEESGCAKFCGIE